MGWLFFFTDGFVIVQSIGHFSILVLLTLSVVSNTLDNLLVSSPPPAPQNTVPWAPTTLPALYYFATHSWSLYLASPGNSASYIWDFSGFYP